MNNEIIFFINTMNHGGAAKMLSYVVGICKHVFDGVTIVSCYNDIKEERKINGIKYIDLGIQAGDMPTWRFSAIRKIRRVVKTVDAKYVCGWASEMAFMVRAATLGLKNTIISAERNDPYMLPFYWRILELWTYKNSNYTFFQLEKAMCYYGKGMATKSFVIPNPYILEDKVVNIAGEDRKKTIVGAGRFREQKGFDVLIKAFANVYAKHPEYKLVLYGEGPLENSYRQLAEEFGIQDAFEMPGYVNHFTATVADEGIYVLSSRFEGIPNSLIEAMSTGIPTVSTDCSPGGPDFLTNHGERGLLVKVDDVDGLSESLLYLIEHPLEAKTFGEKGKEVIEMLKESVIRQKWEDAFMRIKGA